MSQTKVPEADSYPIPDTKASHHIKSELENKSVAASGYGRIELEGSLPPHVAQVPELVSSLVEGDTAMMCELSSMRVESEGFSSVDEQMDSGSRQTDV